MKITAPKFVKAIKDKVELMFINPNIHKQNRPPPIIQPNVQIDIESQTTPQEIT